jgi:uncharacterized protein DUF3108
MRNTFFVVLLVAMASTASALTTPERLTFNIYYAGVYAGTAVQELRRNGEMLQATSTARSADWLTWIFKVEDRVESSSKVVNDHWCPVSYSEKIHEGRTRRDKKITFNNDLTATVEDFRAKKATSVSVTEATFDSLSCFAYTRTKQLEPGMKFSIDIYDGKELHPAVVTVLRRELVTTAAGAFKTVVVHPQLKTGGIFDKTGDLLIWMSDDARHLPVKMVSKVRIGSITAELAKTD